MSRKYFILLAAFALVLSTSCLKDDDDPGPTDQELITTVALVFTDGGGMVSSFEFADLDGPGGLPAVKENINLKANTSYGLAVAFFDNSDIANPVNITEEVLEEADEHLVCYEVTGAVAAPVIIDKDANNKPLGLGATLQTGAAGGGTLKITLKHEPDKNAANPCSTGETDAEVTFDVVIQ